MAGPAPTQGYQRQVAPGQFAPRGERSAASYGAEAGAGMAAFGARLNEMSAEEHDLELRRRRQVDAAQAGVDFARLSGDLEDQIQSRRDEAAPDAAGHVEQVTQDAADRTEAFLGAIPNTQIRDAYRVQAEELMTRVHGSERDWARARRIDHEETATREEVDLFANQIQTNPDDLTFWQNVGAIHTSIEQRQLPPEVAAHLLREQLGAYGSAYVNGKIEQDPAAALAALRGHSLDDILPPAQRAHLEDAAQVEVRVRDADARRQLETARTSARQAIDVFQQRLRDHDPTITDADIEAHQRLAAGAQLGTDVYDLGKARVMHRIDVEYRNANPVEIRAAIGAIDARIATAGDHAAPEDVIRRDQLQSLLTQRTAAVQADPLAAYSHAGGAVAPVDFADPASVRARVTAARAAQQQTGFLQVLNPQETALLREQAGSGPAGRLQAINALAAIVAADPQAGLNAAKEIAPNDAAFQHALRVGPAVRGLVVRGAEARRVLPARVPDANGEMASFDAITQNWFAAHVAPSLTRSQPEFVNGVLESARDIYAEIRRQNGASGQEPFNERNFASAVNLALGRGTHGGGLGQWNWGPRAANGDGPGFLLPARMDQRTFESVMARLPTAREGRTWQGAANGVPVYANGQPVSTDDIRRRYVPVAIRDGVYQFQWRDEVLHARDPHGRIVLFELDAYAAQARWPAPSRPAGHQRPAAPPAARDRDPIWGD